jgi:thioredoxin-dependent peroxiredoxin
MTTTAIPAEGKAAPDFTLPTDTGEPLKLSSLRGKKVVLYFYPKDDTEGCTKEACELRDAFPRFGKLDAVILGVSPDSVKSHQKFKAKYELPFTLLADTEHAVSEQYGLWQEKTMYGRKYMGVVRTTFIIDEKGRIAKVFEKVKPEGHAAQVADAVQALA